jgi:hypothetical protein
MDGLALEANILDAPRSDHWPIQLWLDILALLVTSPSDLSDFGSIIRTSKPWPHLVEGSDHPSWFQNVSISTKTKKLQATPQALEQTDLHKYLRGPTDI